MSRKMRVGCRMGALCIGSTALLLVGAASATAATITVGPAANGTTRALKPGDTLIVRLPGNPTTGYRWSASSVPTALRRVSTSYIAAPPGRLGQGGTFVFRYTYRGGKGTLRLVYRRPWEKDRPPLRAFAVTLRAR